jgi:hypothetical protein
VEPRQRQVAAHGQAGAEAEELAGWIAESGACLRLLVHARPGESGRSGARMRAEHDLPERRHPRLELGLVELEFVELEFVELEFVELELVELELDG